MSPFYPARRPVEAIQAITAVVKAANPPKVLTVSTDEFEALLEADLVEYKFRVPYYKDSNTLLMLEAN